MDALTLGIDVGTSATKGVVADATGKVLWTAAASYQFAQPRPGWAEQDPADWWKAVCKVIRILLGEHPDLETRIGGVGVSGQGVAAVFLDDAGQALRPAILWLDSRCAAQAEALEKRLGKQIAAISGKRPAAYNVAPKLLWVAQNEPEVWARAWKVMTTTAYITYRLTGRPVMNHSDGGILLAYDLAGRSWSRELQEAMELPPKIYCELADCDEIIGSVTPAAAEATGLRVGTPVVAGGEDTSSAGLAVGVLSPQDALLSLGTAATVYVPAVEPRLDARLLAFPHVIRGLTLVGGSMVAGGSAMSWIAKLLDADHSEGQSERNETFEKLTREAEQTPPGSDGLLFLPYLSGELQPINDGFARGVFMGLSLSTRRAHLVRAVMEGTAFAIQHNLSVARATGTNPRRLVAVGAPTQNRLWCQIISDVRGLGIDVMQERGGAALGDAILAALGAGLVQGPEEMQKAHAVIEARYSPRETVHRRYEELHSLYCEVYPRLQDLFPRLTGRVAADKLQ